MARKNQEAVIQLRDAIDSIKKIKAQNPTDNPELIEALDLADRMLLDKLFQAVSSMTNKAKAKKAKL